MLPLVDMRAVFEVCLPTCGFRVARVKASRVDLGGVYTCHHTKYCLWIPITLHSKLDMMRFIRCMRSPLARYCSLLKEQPC